MVHRYPHVPDAARNVHGSSSRPSAQLLDCLFWHVGDPVDHHVADLSLLDERQQIFGRDAGSLGCFGSP